MRDSRGSWICGFMINLGSGDIQQAEAWALFYGLQLAIRCGQQSVEFESDSATIINPLKDDHGDMHPLGTILLNCKSLSINFTRSSFRHIHRERNNAADFLAKASLDNDQGIIWLNSSPPAMANILADDTTGVATARRIPVTSSCCPAVYPTVQNESANLREDYDIDPSSCWTNRNARVSLHDEAQRRNTPDIREASNEGQAEEIHSNSPNVYQLNLHDHAIRDGHVISDD